jgi:hypothetical protein
MFYAHEFWFKTTNRVLNSVEELDRDERIQEAVVVFIHAEAEDEEQSSKVLTKMVKNIKWMAGKFNSKNVVLHSFSHLSTSSASPDFAQQLLVDAEARLKTVGFTAQMTPFGYLHEFSLHVSGESLGRVFKDI